MRILFIFTLTFVLSISASAAVRTWDGGGTDANFSTAANWVGDVAPSPGDDLVFPAVAAQYTANNSFFFLTSFNSITFEGGAYTLTGNPLRLASGLNVLSGSQTINLAVTLTASQMFNASSGASATIVVLSVGSFTLTIDGGGTIGIGLISGSGPVIKNGLGAAAIIAASSFSGPITVNGGVFVVDANIPNSTVTVNSTTTAGGLGLSGFGGTGTVGATTVLQGAISAGTFSSPTGILNITNGLTFGPNGAYVCKIAGPAPGSGGHDQLNVTGAVNLNNARLAPLRWNAYRPPVGESYVILRNDGSDPISGTFLNAPEGSVFAGPLNTAFRITYLGGDGNDIVITRVPKAHFDFDGDGKTDIGAFVNGTWHIAYSSLAGSIRTTRFGLDTDQITPSDFDGDNKTDIAVFRPSNGVWYILNSFTSTVSFTQFGSDGDLAIPNDFDGDGRADITVFRPSTGAWYELRSLTGEVYAQHFGAPGDKPQVADFDGDGMGDLVVFRPSNGAWYFLQSSDGVFVAFPWGIATDVPVPADYDGDGRTDAAVFRASADASQADFYMLLSAGFVPQYGWWGNPGDLPVIGDYDGDGRSDLVVVRPNADAGQPDDWYILGTTSGFVTRQFIRSNRPLAGAYIR